MDSRPIFVFGSNLAGRHEAGAALHALREYGAIAYEGSGRMGHSYAIPTKDRRLNPLPLPSIGFFVLGFIEYAEAHPELQFLVTRIGCGLAGYKDEDMAPMFADAPSNCQLPAGG